MRSCEPEIQEVRNSRTIAIDSSVVLPKLMRQIDLLLENKRSEWEKRTGDVRRQLERREDELRVTRAQLERKTAEVGRGKECKEENDISLHISKADRLHSNLGELSEVHCEKSRAYDSQLKSLKGEVL